MTSVQLFGSQTQGFGGEEAFLATGDKTTGALHVFPKAPGIPAGFFLTDTGNGTGTFNLNGNYSAAPVDFFFTATTQYDIHSVILNISDNATFNQIDYGGIAGGLPNGIKFFLVSNSIETPLVNRGILPVKQNYQWISLTPDFSLTTFAGTAQTLSVEFQLSAKYGAPFTLKPADKFLVRLNDDFTGLTSHTFSCRGILY